MQYTPPPDARAGRKFGTITHNAKVCSFPGCENRSHSRGLCTGHWNQWHKGRELTPLVVQRRVIDGHKVCRVCEENLPVSEFHKKKSTVQETCKSCKSIILRSKEYGITVEEVKRLLAQPCNACGAIVSGRSANIDHCHAKGHVRGMLCNNCNSALGAVNDSVERLQQLIAYLGRTA